MQNPFDAASQLERLEDNQDDDLDKVLRAAFETASFVSSTPEPLRKFGFLLKYGRSSEFLERFARFVKHIENEGALFLSSLEDLAPVNLADRSMEEALEERWATDIEPAHLSGLVAKASPQIRTVAATLDQYERDLLAAGWKYDPKKKRFKSALKANNRPNLLFNQIVRDLHTSWRKQREAKGEWDSLASFNSIAFRKYAADQLKDIFSPELLKTASDGAIALAVDALVARK